MKGTGKPKAQAIPIRKPFFNLKKIIRPYLFISWCGILAFAPVSFMLRALKNDIIALEYPINHFISQCIRNGELPAWFNSWGMGFPLHSSLTWGIYSTPQVLFSSLFNYNIYVLHIEFMFFILLSGWSMFYLLKKHFLEDERTAQMLAVCFMLSGFMVGSTQWLLYITAAAFVPLLISTLLELLKNPTRKNAFQVAVCYTLMFTSVYSAFNIITTYSLLIFLAGWLWQNKKNKAKTGAALRGLLWTGLFTFVLCAPVLFFTLELLGQVDRGNGLSAGSSFFNSNYLHPGALGSMLFPFSSVKMVFDNTEGTMLNTYAGLFLLALLPFAASTALKSQNKQAFILFGTAALFLLFSFGHLTPARNALNVLPGFSYFRNPAIFRFFFIFSLILFAATASRGRSFKEIIQQRFFRYTLWLAAIICIITIIANRNSLEGLFPFAMSTIVSDLTWSQVLLINACIQLFIIILLLLLIANQKMVLAKYVFAADLVVNTLLCTPFFSVSSYSLPQLNSILRTEKGFPIQQQAPSDVPAVYTDSKGNHWQNVNVFSKQISAGDSYRGPLTLKSLTLSRSRSSIRGKPLVFSSHDSSSKSVRILVQKPGHVKALVQLEQADTITLLQNYYPGWKVYANGKLTAISGKGRPGISVKLAPGFSSVDFRYDRKPVWIPALLLHLIIIGFGLLKLKDLLIKRTFRSSSLS